MSLTSCYDQVFSMVDVELRMVRLTRILLAVLCVSISYIWIQLDHHGKLVLWYLFQYFNLCLEQIEGIPVLDLIFCVAHLSMKRRSNDFLNLEFNVDTNVFLSGFIGLIFVSPFTGISDIFYFLYLIICPPFAFLAGMFNIISSHQTAAICRWNLEIDFETYCQLIANRNETHVCCPG